MKGLVIYIILAAGFSLGCWSCRTTETKSEKPATIGVYYFDGWAGRNRHADNPDEPWAANAPTHLTRRFVEEFGHREPVWGWRDDSPEIMQRQIDLAADNGVDFFLFCWYWKDDGGTVNPEAIAADSKHTSMEMYLKVPNKDKLKYSLLIANHAEYNIEGPENWEAAVRYWMHFFNDPQYLTVDGKPLVVIFNPKGIDNASLARMQEVAKAEGLPGLAIAGCGGGARQVSGFTHTTHYNVVPGYDAGSEAHAYQELVDATEKQWIGTEKQPYIPELTAGWDKRPWEGPQGLNQKEGWYFPDRTPAQFKGFMNDAVRWMDENPEKTTKERIMLIYAWNELGEGGYLVPTKGDPEASYLNMIREVSEGR